MGGTGSGTLPAGTITSTSTTPNDNTTWLYTLGSSTAANPLPIHLLSFTGKTQASTIELQWATATEQNNDYMAVERSADGKAFDEIGRVPGNGTTLEPQSYTLTDRRPLPGINYYRLRQVDFDGAIEYHPVISISFKGNAANGITLQAYPNPVQDELSIAWNTASTNDQEAAQLRIMDASGRLVAQYALTGNGGVFTAPVAALPVGLYFLQLEQGGKVQVGRFVKE